MALHNISEAARLAGKSRSTVHRHIKEGKLSKVIGKDGSPAVETSELRRVYGDLSHQDSSEPAVIIHHDTPSETGSFTSMEVELAALRIERDNLREERDRWANQAERLTRLLSHDTGARERRTGWLGRLLDRR